LIIVGHAKRVTIRCPCNPTGPISIKGLLIRPSFSAKIIGTLLDNTISLMLSHAYINAYFLGRDFMRKTLNIKDELLNKAAKLTGIKEKTSLVRLGLEALIAKESSKRLAKLGGTEKKLEMIRRRRNRET
jgi:Arc/MetJ family transcription regulator